MQDGSEHTKPKYYECCAPGCPTYNTSSSFLRFPMDSQWRKQWLEAVPKKNWVIDHTTVLCMNHFRPDEVAAYSRFKDESGNVRTVKNSAPLVKRGAVPSIFNTIEAETQTLSPPYMFQILSRDKSPEIFSDVEDQKDIDFIIDYAYFINSFKQKLKAILGNWGVLSNCEYTLFYILDSVQVPSVSASVKVDSTLLVSVSLQGREMDPADLTWILPMSAKINRWSQLKLLLYRFQPKN